MYLLCIKILFLIKHITFALLQPVVCHCLRFSRAIFPHANFSRAFSTHVLFPALTQKG